MSDLAWDYYDDIFSGLEDYEKLPEGDPRGILAFRSYPPVLQRLMDSRQYTDWEHRITRRNATPLEREFLRRLGYLDADEQRPVVVRIVWRRGVREMHFYLGDVELGAEDNDQSQS